MESAPLEERIAHTLTVIDARARLLKTWKVSGGISATTMAFEAEMGDGDVRKFIVRQPTPGYTRHGINAAREEFRIWSELASRGLPVKQPIAIELVDGYFVMDYIEGQPELSATDPIDYARKFAEMLAMIHLTPLSGLDFLPREPMALREREPQNDSLREGEVRRAVAEYGPVSANEPVLRHGDFWPGNVIWRDQKIVGVIDWEECVIGEPLADIGICRLDLWWILGHVAAEAFTQRYCECISIDMTDLAYWDLRTALRPMGNLGEWADSFPSLGRPDVTEATMRRDLLEFIDQAFIAID